VPLPDEKASPVQVGFSVPKKKFRSSVHRHRIRRLMAEAWRLNKHTLYAAIPESQQLHLFLIFTDAAMPEYDVVKAAVVKGIGKLVEKIVESRE
jgi:ribonuclease P protein component